MSINKKRIGAVILTMAMVTVSPMVPVTPTGISAAAGKPKLESGKGTYLTGESQTVKIKNIKK